MAKEKKGQKEAAAQEQKRFAAQPGNL